MTDTTQELIIWRAKQPLLDKLADMLGVCEGVCPLRAAISELDKLKQDRDRLRKALDAAKVVLGSDPFVPEAAVERWEVEGEFLDD